MPQPLLYNGGGVPDNPARAVWATSDRVTSRAFGIDRTTFGSIYLYPKTKTLELINWRLHDIPKHLLAYTYYVDSRLFSPVNEWQYVCRRPVPVLHVEAYQLRDSLLHDFDLWEVSRRKPHV